MQLPKGGEATIDPRKIIDYSLDPDHDDRKHKAHLFRDLLGLTRDNAQLLVDALKEDARSGAAVPGRLDKYGQRDVIDFEFAGPGGKAIVRSA